MTVVLGIVQVCAALILVTAGIGKLAVPRDFGATVRDLGAPVRLVTLTLPLLEIVAGTLIVADPTSVVTAVLSGGLVCAFAWAGGTALVRRRLMVCSCFGGLSRGALGWRQVALLPAWSVALTAMHAIGPGIRGVQGVLWLTLAIVVTCTVLAVRHRDMALEAHRAIEELAG